MPATHLLDPPKRPVPSVPAAALREAARPGRSAAAARLYWMLVGNAALYLTAVAIVQQGHNRAWTANVAFSAAVISLVVVRYVDVTRLDGATATGEPASFSDWYRYARRLFMIALGVWITAHATALFGF